MRRGFRWLESGHGLKLLHWPMAPRPKTPEFLYGPGAANRAEDALNSVLRISKDELRRREEDARRSRNRRREEGSDTPSTASGQFQTKQGSGECER